QQDQIAAVGSAQGTIDWPFNAKCEPDIPLMEPSLMGLIFDSAFINLDQWVKKGIPAPRAPRIRLTNPGTPQDVIATNKPVRRRRRCQRAATRVHERAHSSRH